MLSYIKSEFYRILRNKWSYLFILICSALLVSSNIVLAIIKYQEPSFGYANTAFSIANFISSIIMIYILCVAVSTMIFGNENGNHTMKNSISYGIPRGVIYFCKLFVEIVYALIAFVIITGFHVASAYLLLENSHMNEFSILADTFVAAVPLFIFALAATNCFAFIVEGIAGAIGFDALLMIAFPIISSFLGMKFEFFHKLAKILPYNLLNDFQLQMKPYQIILPWEGSTGYYNCWLAGILQTIIIVIIGYLVFRKREIK